MLAHKLSVPRDFRGHLLKKLLVEPHAAFLYKGILYIGNTKILPVGTFEKCPTCDLYTQTCTHVPIHTQTYILHIHIYIHVYIHTENVRNKEKDIHIHRRERER